MKLFPIMYVTSHRAREEIEQLRDALCVSVVIGLPWPMMMSHERQAQKNHSQTIQRLAERGGLAPCEACAVLEDRDWHSMSRAASHERLKKLFQEYVAAMKAA